MPSYTLTYFNGRGRAELTRLVFAAAGVQYEDKRITDWPAGKEDAPLGQLPYLTVDGNKLPQSISMARFVARRHNLAGSDDLAQAQSDAVVDTVADLQNAYYQKVFMVKTEEASQKFFAEDALNHLGKLEKIITLYGSEGFSVGSSLTWADLHLWDVTSILVGTQANILDAFPRVKAVRKSVEANEGVAKWLKARPETQF